MSQDVGDRVRDLIEKARQAGTGPIRVALYEEAARVADAHGEERLGWSIRLALIEAAVFAEESEKTLAPLAWCLSLSDRNPVNFRESELLWPIKWVVSHARLLARVPRAHLEAMLDDMEYRFLRQGASFRAVWRTRFKHARSRGDRDASRLHYDRWNSAPRDRFADCLACEQDARVDFLAFDGRDAEAMEAAAPILDGRMRCAEVPLGTYGTVLMPLVRLGRVQEAMTYHNRAFPLIAPQSFHADYAAPHLGFLAITDNLPRGLKLMETHLPWPRSGVAADREDRFDFCLSAIFLMARAASAGRGKPITLRLPREFPLHNTSGRYDPAALSGFFEAEGARIGSLFDARNGTSYFSDRIAEVHRLDALITPCPLHRKMNEEA